MERLDWGGWGGGGSVIRRRRGCEVCRGIAGEEQMAKKLKGGQWLRQQHHHTQKDTEIHRY